MGCFKNISLQQFGRLQACFPVRKTKGGQMLWACWCSCDNIAIVCTGSLTSGHAKSCGCLNREISSVWQTRKEQGAEKQIKNQIKFLAA